MLVQKTGLNKRTKILLIIFCTLLLPGGYFIYSTYFAKPSVTNTVPDTTLTALEQPVVVTPLNEGLLNDAQIGTFMEKNAPGFAEQLSGVYLDADVPLAPEKIAVTDPGTGGRLLVSWQLPLQKNFTTVKVYRSEQVGVLGEEVYTATVKATDTLQNYTDHDLANLTTYYYIVLTVNAEGAVSKNGQQFPGTPHDTFPPSAPLNVTVQNVTDSQVKISWLVPLDPDFSTVHIYKSSERGLLGNLVSADIQNDSENMQYILDTVIPNVPYFYTVTGVDASGNESSTDVMAAPYRENPFQP